MLIDYLFTVIFLSSGAMIYYKLNKWGYGSNIRVLGTALGFYLGPIALLGLFFMKGKKDE